ncbi:hypothetical protein EDB83DRAFT_1152188 [Lactarius deliciosus]|nr:hypothetical protein EDB83DRAFT_1152188 [Lactarius deliciosus]
MDFGVTSVRMKPRFFLCWLVIYFQFLSTERLFHLDIPVYCYTPQSHHRSRYGTVVLTPRFEFSVGREAVPELSLALILVATEHTCQSETRLCANWPLDYLTLKYSGPDGVLELYRRLGAPHYETASRLSFPLGTYLTCCPQPFFFFPAKKRAGRGVREVLWGIRPEAKSGYL